MARDCELATAPVSGSMMGLAVGDAKLTSGRVETYPLRLPLPLRDRVAFAAAGLKVQMAVRRYRRVANATPGAGPEEVRSRVLAHRAGRHGHLRARGCWRTFARWRDTWSGFLPRRLREAGMIVRADDRGDSVLQIAPPLISDRALLDEIVDRLADVLTDAGTHMGVGAPRAGATA
jgi:hypothetical protein